jgi:hypothetical protein
VRARSGGCERAGAKGDGHALGGEPGEVVAEEGETGVRAGGEQPGVCDLDGDLPVGGDVVAPGAVHETVPRWTRMKRDASMPLFFFHTSMATSSAPTTPVTTPVSSPSHADLAAVAATVAVVGVLMALLIAWLVVRLRRAGQAQAIPIVARRPASTASYTLRPSFAPSEASSKFGFGACPPNPDFPRSPSLIQLASPSASPARTRTAAGTLRTPIRSPIRKRSPQNTVRHRCPPHPPTHRAHTARAHTRTSLVPVHPPPRPWSNHPPHTVEGSLLPPKYPSAPSRSSFAHVHTALQTHSDTEPDPRPHSIPPSCSHRVLALLLHLITQYLPRPPRIA